MADLDEESKFEREKLKKSPLSVNRIHNQISHQVFNDQSFAPTNCRMERLRDIYVGNDWKNHNVVHQKGDGPFGLIKSHFDDVSVAISLRCILGMTIGIHETALTMEDQK